MRNSIMFLCRCLLILLFGLVVIPGFLCLAVLVGIFQGMAAAWHFLTTLEA
jgi:hypothetical protein